MKSRKSNSAAEADPHSVYVGRFAPSPTGPLHFGSLLAALASFLDARANNGLWLLRMEDLDPPREPADAAETILQQLQDLHLHWDGEVLYQSSRQESYLSALTTLAERGLSYHCDCNRQRVRDLGSVYDGACRRRSTPASEPFAIRLRTRDEEIGFEDLIQGHFRQNLERDVGDFIIRRKDRLFAYQLAVVIDDAFQGVTDVVRGWDLLDSTPRQLYLQSILGYPQPRYAHIPIAVNAAGQKLSKQHFAKAIDAKEGSELVYHALDFLGQNPPGDLHKTAVGEQLDWAIQHWDIQAVPKLATMPESPD